MGRRIFDEEIPALLEKHKSLTGREYNPKEYRNRESVRLSELLEIVGKLKTGAAEGRQIEIMATINKPGTTPEEKIRLADEHQRLEEEIKIWSVKP
jgi:hypothetical protein